MACTAHCMVGAGLGLHVVSYIQTHVTLAIYNNNRCCLLVLGQIKIMTVNLQ